MTSPHNIVLLPSDALAERATRLSHELSGEQTFFELDGTQFFPHLSIYMVQLETAHIADVSAYLARTAAQTAPLELSAENYGGKRGYFGITYPKTAVLEKLQSDVVEAVNPLRSGLTPEEAEKQPTATGIMRHNIDTYGYKSIGELFVPHMTLTRFTKPDASPDPDDASLPAPDSFSGQFPWLGLFAVGEHGTCIREVARFALIAEDG